MGDYFAPLGAHAGYFVGVGDEVFAGLGEGFVVVEDGVGGVEDAVAGFADFKAEVDVVEGDGELGFVEAADLPEDV